MRAGRAPARSRCSRAARREAAAAPRLCVGPKTIRPQPAGSLSAIRRRAAGGCATARESVSHGRRALAIGRLLVAALLGVLSPSTARAEWQLMPFAAFTFGGGTTFLDVEQAAGDLKLALGGRGVYLGEILGLEGDLLIVPGFFDAPEQRLVTRSTVTTLTGSVVVALPRRLTERTLRPYAVGGLGLMRVRMDQAVRELQLRSNLLAFTVGGGATGFVTPRIGLNWDVRYYRNIRGTDPGRGLSIGPPRLSFWRASMAVVVRYGANGRRPGARRAGRGTASQGLC